MDTRQLACFIATAEGLSFTRAAEKLYLSQPTVSYQIAQLEKELGFPLFVRDANSLSLTPGGAAFFEGAGELMEGIRSLTEKAREAQNSHAGIVTVWNPNYIHDALFPVAVAEFSSCHGGVDVVVELHRDELGKSLRSPSRKESARERVDVQLLPDRCSWDSVAGWEHAPLCHVVAHAIMSARHPLAEKTGVSLEDVRPYPLVVFAPAVMDEMDLWYWHRIREHPDDYTVETCSFATFEELQINMANSNRVLFSRGTYAQLMPCLVQVPFTEGELLRNVVVWKDDPSRPLVSEFVAFLREFYSRNWVCDGFEALKARRPTPGASTAKI